MKKLKIKKRNRRSQQAKKDKSIFEHPKSEHENRKHRTQY